MRRAVFFDKDGTLVDDVPYNVDPQKIRLRKGAVTALRRLSRAGFAIGIVTNQGGVARGYFREADLARVEEHLCKAVGPTALKRGRFFYCPHHPDGTVAPYNRHCICRKPRPGLLLKAARRLRVPLRDCWMVGDILDDVETGRRAGCRAVFVDTGGETEWRPGRYRTPDFRVTDLAACARIILRGR